MNKYEILEVQKKLNITQDGILGEKTRLFIYKMKKTERIKKLKKILLLNNIST